MADPLHLALASLPHGPEFRFVDRLLALDPGISGIGEYTLKGGEYFLHGHFPGSPLMPGVLMIEAVAQLAGVVAQSDPKIGALANLRLTALRGVKISGSATPGQVLTLEVQIVGRLGNLIQARGKATVESLTVLELELTLSGGVQVPQR